MKTYKSIKENPTTVVIGAHIDRTPLKNLKHVSETIFIGQPKASQVAETVMESVAH